MKVLQVIPGNLKDGTTVYSSFIQSEIMGLESMGIDIKKFFFTARMSIKGFLVAKNHLDTEIAEYKPDIIHVHTGSTTTFLVAVAKKKSVPWIITFGGSELLGNHHPGLKWLVRDTISVFLSRISARMCNGIICVSKNLQDALPKNSKKKSVIIPRGVDLSLFKPIDKLTARKELGISNGEIVVLFSMNRTNSIVKNKALADKVVEDVETKNGIPIKMITLIGYTPKEVVLLLNAADALLVTSLHEGSPNIVKEAMACNLPVIAVNCGDVDERLKNVNNSYVHPYDKELLSNSLWNIIAQKSRSNGREQLVNQGIDRKSIVSKIKSYYDRVQQN